MVLTKKQKKFVIDNYENKDINEIARDLNVSSAEVNKYLEARGITTEKQKIEKKRGIQFKNYYYVLIIVFTALVVGIICFDTNLYVSGDNAIYINLGKGIAEGKGMQGHTQYPFGFPLMLAIVQIISGDSLLAQKILVFLLYLGCIPLIFLVFKNYIGEKWS